MLFWQMARTEIEEQQHVIIWIQKVWDTSNPDDDNYVVVVVLVTVV